MSSYFNDSTTSGYWDLFNSTNPYCCNVNAVIDLEMSQTSLRVGFKKQNKAIIKIKIIDAVLDRVFSVREDSIKIFISRIHVTTITIRDII